MWQKHFGVPQVPRRVGRVPGRGIPRQGGEAAAQPDQDGGGGEGGRLVGIVQFGVFPTKKRITPVLDKVRRRLASWVLLCLWPLFFRFVFRARFMFSNLIASSFAPILKKLVRDSPLSEKVFS